LAGFLEGGQNEERSFKNRVIEAAASVEMILSQRALQSNEID
jgi:hypothetical protein